MRKKIEKNFWDMEIIGNRRKILFIKISQLNLSSFVIIRSQENKLLTNKKVGFRELISDWMACLKTDWFYCSFTNIVAKEGKY